MKAEIINLVEHSLDEIENICSSLELSKEYYILSLIEKLILKINKKHSLEKIELLNNKNGLEIGFTFKEQES